MVVIRFHRLTIILLALLIPITAFCKGKEKQSSSPSLRFYEMEWPKDPPQGMRRLIILNISPSEFGERYSNYLTYALTNTRRAFRSDDEVLRLLEANDKPSLVQNPLDGAKGVALKYEDAPVEEAYLPAWASTATLTVLDRAQLKEIFKELGYAQDEMFNEQQVLRIGKLAKADGIISLLVTVQQDGHDVETQSMRQKVTGGKTITRTYEINVVMQITSVETGTFAKSYSVSSSVEFDQEVNALNPTLIIPDAETMREFVFRRAVDKLANELSPHLALRECELESCEGSVAGSLADEASEEARRYEPESVVAAYCRYLDVFHKDDDGFAPPLYNLGVLHRSIGNYKSALEKFTAAQQIDANAKMYRDAMQNAQSLVYDLDLAEASGLSIEELGIEARCSEMPKALAALPGGSERKYPLYEAQDSSSVVVANGRGGNQYLLIETSNDWTRIELAHNKKSGWIQSDQLK